MIKHRSFSLLRRQFSTSLRPEVCIVGGGPAGAALACTLSQSNYFNRDDKDTAQILLLDSSKLPQLETYKSNQDRQPEPRVVTLSPSSLRMLRSLDVLQRCNHECITPFQDMIVYEEAGSSYMRFNNQKHSERSILVQMEKQLINTLFNED